MDAGASTVPNRTPLPYVMSKHRSHTTSLVHSFHLYPPVPAQQTFTYSTSDPPSPSHDSSAESVTTKVNLTPHNNPHNPVPNVPADPGSDPSSSDFTLSDSSKSSDDEYYKQRQCTKKNINNRQSKKHFNNRTN